ncbi:MAG: hypothetical protein DYH02_11400 [Candidatus Omnitrophica bacterium COP1]|nr:hypothetical protein [Candidatus Omnitrophica bacterium COP1]
MGFGFSSARADTGEDKAQDNKQYRKTSVAVEREEWFGMNCWSMNDLSHNYLSIPRTHGESLSFIGAIHQSTGNRGTLQANRLSIYQKISISVCCLLMKS